MAEIFEKARQPREAWCDTTHLHVRLNNGLVLAVPLWWYPKLLNASMPERNQLWLSPSGVHWEKVDEDVAVQGLFEGWRAKDAIEPSLYAAE